MSGQTAKCRSATGSRGGAGARGEAEFHHLVRCVHIFASAVREVLETKLLREVTPFPLTISQFHLLKLMSFDGRHQVGEVADFLGVTPPAATKNVDKLEGLGLVVRHPSKGDRRATLLSVSPKGRRLVRKYERLKATRLSPVLEDFRPRELEQLPRLLERFAVSLLAREPSEGEFCLRCAAYIDRGCPVGEIHGGCPYQKARGAQPGDGASAKGS